MPSSTAALVLCLAAAAAGAEEPRKPPAPAYTNDDLDRVSPRRGDTGVLSTAPPALPAPASSEPPGERHGEQYWRREAERLRDRLESLRERAAELRIHLEELERRPPSRSRGAQASRTGDAQKEAARARLEVLERRIREVEDAFLDRARREGALPGWLR